jgi:leader peptidase (prepilin peptidase)/N-methyltransferase
MSFLPAIMLGLAAGFLVDYLADILPTRSKWGSPICTHCGSARNWKDFFVLAACRNCQKPRSLRTLFTLAVEMVISCLLWVFPPLRLGYWFGLLLVAFLSVVFIIDVEHHLILHPVSLFGALLGFVTGTISHRFLSTLLGGLAGFLLMMILYWLGVLFSRLRAQKQGLPVGAEEALGFGDVTISGVLGLMMGFSNVFYGLMTGILLAGVFSLFLIVGLLIAKKFKTGELYIPYGPFLILGACVYIFFK